MILSRPRRLPHILATRLAVFCICLDEVAAVARTLLVKKWRVLGPFIIGKNELDGEPWRLSNASELVSGGLVDWQRFTTGNDGMLHIEWRKVEWQSLVQGVGGHELLEWQALAQGSFKFKEETEASVACLGVPAFRLDDRLVPFVGDLYRAGLPGHPVLLSAGTHRFEVRVRAKLRGQISCSVMVNTPKVSLSGAGGAIMVPDVVQGRLANDLAVVHAVNAHPSEWLRHPRLVAGSPAGDVTLAAKQPVLHALAPGQIAGLAFHVVLVKPGCPTGRLRIFLEGEHAGKIVRSEALSLPALRCRDLSQSFVFTFIDSDGSVQHAGAVAPDTSAFSSATAFPVVLSLSGTSISASDSADSYKMKARPDDAEFSFGVRGAWLLAPTRHGAHNWEGPGRSTAFSALRALGGVADALGAAADTGRLVFAGHSMGGHGAWLLGVAGRQEALGLVSNAGWLRKDQYSDSNKVLMHDVAVYDVEPALQALLRAAESEFDADGHAATLAGGLPILIRVGTADNNVHPWFSRRMFRSLLGAGALSSEVSLSELRGKEHWWWDTDTPNDGGAVNDLQIRNFFDQCFKRESGAAGLPAHWRLVVFNAATSGAKGGLRVVQQLVPHRRTEIIVEMGKVRPSMQVQTSNARRLEWNVAEFRVLAHKHGQDPDAPVVIDGQELHVPHSAVALSWCQVGRLWEVCNDTGDFTAVQRSSGTLGPIRQLFTASVCAIVGDEDELSRSAARFVADMLVMTGHGYLPILLAAEVLDELGHLNPPEFCHNLLIVGGPYGNHAAEALLQARPDMDYTPPLEVGASGNHVSLGGCRWAGESVTALALLPWWRPDQTKAKLALLVAGPSQSAAEALALLATPTIPPMTRQPLTHLLPDYVVLDIAETRSRGAGGFLAAGFWGHRWQHEPLAAWDRLCRPPAGICAAGTSSTQCSLP